MSDSFVHLHVHTEWALGDSNARVEHLCTRAARLGMPALAITDHGSLHGLPAFVRAARSADLKAILGMEAYLAVDPGRRGLGRNQPACGEDWFGHLTLWAETHAGLRNLFRLASRSAIDVDPGEVQLVGRDLLAEHATGLIGTTGCADGEVQGYLRQDRYSDALAAAADLRDIFGPDHLFVEVVAPHLVGPRVRHGLVRIARDLNLPLVATNDVHYVDWIEGAQNRVVLGLKHRARSHAPGDLSLDDGDWRHLASSDQMRAWFAELPGACDATLEIAERCSATLPPDAPSRDLRRPIPADHTAESWLAERVAAGLNERYPGGVPEAATARAQHELRVIAELGHTQHFLIMADQVGLARREGIVIGPGRASSASSLCSYALRITHLDPLEHGLVFERLLNHEAREFQGLPIEVASSSIGAVIENLTFDHGHDRVAAIARPIRYSARRAAQEAARLAGWAEDRVERVRLSTPLRLPLADLHNAAHTYFVDGEPLRQLCRGDDDIRQLVHTATAIEGLLVSYLTDTPAWAVSGPPIAEVLPTIGLPDGSSMTQFVSDDAVAQGAMRLEFVPHPSLDVVARTLQTLRSIGVEVRLDELSRTPTDRTTYRLLKRGNTAGVVGLDRADSADLLRDMVPDSFADLIAFVTMTRPLMRARGAVAAYARRKHGLEMIAYPHAELAEVLPVLLGDSQGLLLYQEQVLRVVQALTGYSPGEADVLRRRLHRGDPEHLDDEFMRFQGAMLQRAHSLDAAAAAWNWLSEETPTTVPKSHMAGQAMITYWMAWLKAHYPGQLGVALASVRRERVVR